MNGTTPDNQNPHKDHTMSKIVSSIHPIAQNIADAINLIPGASVIRATYDSWIAEGHDKAESHWYKVTFPNGFVLNIGSAAYNKPQHFHIYPDSVKDAQNQDCKPYNKSWSDSNILRSSTAKRMANALTKCAEANRETYEEALTIQERHNEYHKTVNSTIDTMAKTPGWKRSNKEKCLTSTNGCDGGYGDVEVFKNSANLNIRNVSHEVALAIMQLVSKAKGIN